MKELRKKVTSIAFALLILVSPNIINAQSSSLSNGKGEKEIIQKSVNDEKLINEFKNLNSKINLKFDYSKVYEVSISGNSETMLIANQVSFSEKNIENYAVSAAIIKGKLSKSLIIKTSKTSSNIYKIEYFNTNMELVSGVELDSNSRTMNSYSNYESEGCGQAVADCLTDVYSNYGWVSVWAFVQTAFIPATGAALAAACAADECL